MKAFRYVLFLLLCLLLQRSSADARPGRYNPQLLDCGRHGELEIICGKSAPEDFERTPDGKILAAGIKGVNGNCPPESNFPCLQGFMIEEVNPEALESRIVYDNNSKALINGVSVAIEAGDAIYVGSFQGDRLVKLPR